MKREKRTHALQRQESDLCRFCDLNFFKSLFFGFDFDFKDRKKKKPTHISSRPKQCNL